MPCVAHSTFCLLVALANLCIQTPQYQIPMNRARRAHHIAYPLNFVLRHTPRFLFLPHHRDCPSIPVDCMLHYVWPSWFLMCNRTAEDIKKKKKKRKREDEESDAESGNVILALRYEVVDIRQVEFARPRKSTPPAVSHPPQKASKSTPLSSQPSKVFFKSISMHLNDMIFSLQQDLTLLYHMPLLINLYMLLDHQYPYHLYPVPANQLT